MASLGRNLAKGGVYFTHKFQFYGGFIVAKVNPGNIRRLLLPCLSPVLSGFLPCDFLANGYGHNICLQLLQEYQNCNFMGDCALWRNEFPIKDCLVHGFVSRKYRLIHDWECLEGGGFSQEEPQQYASNAVVFNIVLGQLSDRHTALRRLHLCHHRQKWIFCECVDTPLVTADLLIP